MILVVGFVIVFVVLLIYNLRHGDRRLCRWREYRSDDHSLWTCVRCGAEVTGAPGRAPEPCRRPKERQA